MERNLGDVTEKADRVRRALSEQASYQEDTRRLVLESRETMKAALRGMAQARAEAQEKVAHAQAQLAAARAQVAAVGAQARAESEARALEQGTGVVGTFIGNVMFYILGIFRGDPEPPSIV